MTEAQAKKLAFEYNVEFGLTGDARFAPYHACGSEYWLADPRGIPQYIFANPYKTSKQLYDIAGQIVKKLEIRSSHYRGSRGHPTDRGGRFFYLTIIFIFGNLFISYE